MSMISFSPIFRLPLRQVQGEKLHSSYRVTKQVLYRILNIISKASEATFSYFKRAKFRNQNRFIKVGLGYELWNIAQLPYAKLARTPGRIAQLSRAAVELRGGEQQYQVWLKAIELGKGLGPRPRLFTGSGRRPHALQKLCLYGCYDCCSLPLQKNSKNYEFQAQKGCLAPLRPSVARQ